jgi:hypothetical protein
VTQHIWTPNLEHVQMKTRRANIHLQTLETELAKWLNGAPYTIVERDDVDKGWHFYFIRINPMSEDIPMSAGDFVCCLRSSLDQLAWNLAHLDSARKFSITEERRINFLIFKERDGTYIDRRRLFPSAVADAIDTFQPYLRGNAYRDDPLWQLNELWTLDKHRTIPANSNNIRVDFPYLIDWSRQWREFDDGVVVRVPLSQVWLSPVDIKPQITIDVLFGEYMGAFEISVKRLREIYDFVTNDVIPRFAGFFP